MSAVNFSLTDDIKQRVDAMSKECNKSATVAELMEYAIIRREAERA